MGISVDPEKDIPKEWLDGIYNAPISVQKLIQISDAVVEQHIDKIPKISWWFQWLRNVALLMIVLLHGFRRLLPPY